MATSSPPPRLPSSLQVTLLLFPTRPLPPLQYRVPFFCLLSHFICTLCSTHAFFIEFPQQPSSSPDDYPIASFLNRVTSTLSFLPRDSASLAMPQLPPRLPTHLSPQLSGFPALGAPSPHFPSNCPLLSLPLIVATSERPISPHSELHSLLFALPSPSRGRSSVGRASSSS